MPTPAARPRRGDGARRKRRFRHGMRRRSRARAPMLDRAADCSRSAAAALIALLQSEGGKTLDDCVSEVREAVDFCRYYAAEARRALGAAAAAGPDRREQRTAPIAAAACSSASARGIFRWRFSSGRSRPRLPPAMPWRPSRPSRRRDRGSSRAHPAPGRRAGRARCSSCPATARSARRWSPTAASPASRSPARPKWRAPSTARSPARTGRSCR